MPTNTYQVLYKDATESLLVKIDWSDWLDGETIASSSWSVPAGLTLVSESTTSTTRTGWIEGGVLGETYYISNSIVTNSGRDNKQTAVVRVTAK